jgi:hypothetical protein
VNSNSNEHMPSWLSPEWLTSALRQKETIDCDVSVESYNCKVLTGGLMASTLLLSLKYIGGKGSEPPTVIGKFPSSDISSRLAGKEMLAYEREVNFYNYLASKLSMRVPGCYFAEIDVGSADFSLLLEDLNPATLATSESEYSLNYAEQSIDQLVLLQRDTWSDNTIQSIPWVLDYSDPKYIVSIKDWAVKGWDILCSVADERLPTEHQRLGKQLIANLETWSRHIKNRACLSHCDYRFANVLYSDKEAITVDWQTIHWGSPGADLAYFLVNSLSVKQFQMWQSRLRERYFKGIGEHGIPYTQEESDFDFDMGIIYCILMLMVTSYGIGSSGLSIPAKNQLLDAISKVMPLAEQLNVLRILKERELL